MALGGDFHRGASRETGVSAWRKACSGKRKHPRTAVSASLASELRFVLNCFYTPPGFSLHRSSNTMGSRFLVQTGAQTSTRLPGTRRTRRRDSWPGPRHGVGISTVGSASDCVDIAIGCRPRYVRDKYHRYAVPCAAAPYNVVSDREGGSKQPGLTDLPA